MYGIVLVCVNAYTKVFLRFFKINSLSTIHCGNIWCGNGINIYDHIEQNKWRHVWISLRQYSLHAHLCVATSVLRKHPRFPKPRIPLFGVGGILKDEKNKIIGKMIEFIRLQQNGTEFWSSLSMWWSWFLRLYILPLNV